MDKLTQLAEQIDSDSSLTDEEKRRALSLIVDRRAHNLRLQRDGGIWLYEPLDYQVPFHKSRAKIRFAFGGNRSGKSVSAHAEAIKLAMGIHEHKKDFPVPNHGWIVSIDFPTSRDVSALLVHQYLPKSYILKWDRQNHVIFLKNGSTIGFKSCDSGVEKFQGTSKHWILFDEEPPESIFKECLMRTIDTKGKIICAMTPTNGMTWTYDNIYEQRNSDPDIDCFMYDTYNNKYLESESLKKLEKMFPSEEREMRFHGKFIQLSGLIFKEYNSDIHIIDPFEIPTGWNWTRFRSIDHGQNNPTGVPLVAINREGEWYIYDEYYEAGKTIQENASAIKMFCGKEKYAWTAIDGSTKNRIANNDSYYDTYKKKGIIGKPVYLNAKNKEMATNYIRELMRVEEKTGRPKFFIFRHCYNTVREISRYRYKSLRYQDGKNKPEAGADVMNHLITALMFLVISKARWIEPQTMQNTPDIVKWY